MNLKEIELIRNATDEQIEIVKYLCGIHPGYYSDTKYAYYTGGFVDTGNWYVDKLLEAHIDDLRGLYQKVQKDEERRKELRQKREEQQALVNAMSPEEKHVYYEKQRQQQEDCLKQFFHEKEMAMLWGKGNVKSL